MPVGLTWDSIADIAEVLGNCQLGNEFMDEFVIHKLPVGILGNDPSS